ncbi:putative lipopolysaccharide heptosyltransferase III [Salmonella enterica subsp. enterica serovar Enteritidis]|nr:putative lipopolysaccharide heptosyltransferase III [Salmonella enterica subsp. enterica serovar Enteritidis]EGW9206055.1 putative lipopolysaccharide heptosyltransferase III [Salmonella enterica subsp. enterica serovar Enteritidis]
MYKKINRILICKLKFHGDMLLITPVISSLISYYPQLTIDILSYKGTEEILAADVRINKFYLIDKKIPLLSKIKNFISVRKQLSKNNYDLIINLTEQWPIGFLISSLRRPSIAFRREKWLWNILFSKVTPMTGTHIIEQNLSILNGIGFCDIDLKKKIQLYYNETDYQVLLALTPELALQKYVVIQPTARQKFKCWDNDKFAIVINYLHHIGFHVYLTCSPDIHEQEQVKKIATQCDIFPDLILAGKISLPQLAALIDHAVLYIGVDSAPMHMAAALGTPQVCLFGATNHQQWRPWSNKAMLIWAGNYYPMPARKDLDRSNKYLSWIPPEAVIEAINIILYNKKNQNNELT